MRIFVLALMILLLPVRGWMGDVMAVEMAVGSLVANNSATNAYATGSSDQESLNLAVSHAECPDHAGMSMVKSDDLTDDPNASQSNDASTHGQCSHCSACNICHSIALMETFPLLAALAQPHQLRPVSGLQFASATTAPHLKPPIS